jgi:RNA polymerase sigma-70 factor (ECF subfamily)
MTDAQQFEVFMSNYQDMVFSTAMRLTANRSEAQDISQEAFLRAYERFAELKNSPTAGAWLRKVATNLSLDHLTRYRSRWSFFSEMFKPRDDEQEAEMDFQADVDVVGEVSGQERRELVDQALASLPAAQRVPLVLYHIEGFHYDEIAKKLNISMAKVKVDIFRGREALRKKLRLNFPEVVEAAS